MGENKRLTPKKASDTKAMTSSNLSNFNALGFDKWTNESAHASMELLKGNRGDNAYELWIKQPGNAGKTYEDYLAFNKQPATDAAKQVTDKMTQIEQEANGVISSTNTAADNANKACPTRGIDIGVKAAIYKLMEQLISEGKAILMVSEEIPELLGMSDRILIMKDGTINGEFDRSEEVTEKSLIEKLI